MAGRLRGNSTQGGGANSHDFVAYDAANQVWNGAAFVAWVDADYAAYRVTATEQGTSGRYVGNEPAGATHYELRVRGATLALSYVVWTDALGVNVTEINGEAATPVDDLPRNVTVTQRSVVVNDN